MDTDNKIAFSAANPAPSNSANEPGRKRPQTIDQRGRVASAGTSFPRINRNSFNLKDVKLEKDVHDLHPDLPKANARLITTSSTVWNDW